MKENIHFSLFGWMNSTPVKKKGPSKNEKENLRVALEASTDKISNATRLAKTAGKVAGLGLLVAGKSGPGLATFVGSEAIGDTILASKNSEHNQAIKEFKQKYGSDELRTQARKILGNKRRLVKKRKK